jgi:pimeloyl-ACP methyl ester carboxylesterase
MKIIVFLVFLASCGHGANSGGSSANCPESQFKKEYNVFGNSTKRVVLSHGVWDSANFWNIGYGVDLRNALVAKGFQVITYTYPNTTDSTWDNGAVCYRKDFVDFSNWMISDLDSKYGPKTEMIFGGFSFGGLHSIIGASAIVKVDRYFGMLPAVDMRVIYKNVNMKHFNAKSEQAALANKDGLIISGDQDTVANHLLSEQWAAEMGNIVTHYNVNIDHRLNQEVIDHVLDWIE